MYRAPLSIRQAWSCSLRVPTNQILFMKRFFAALFAPFQSVSCAGLVAAMGLGLASVSDAAEPEYSDRQFDFALIGDTP